MSTVQTRKAVSAKIKVASAVLVVVAILILFILPAFDVAPTALRAARAIAVLMLAIAFAAFVLFGEMQQVHRVQATHPVDDHIGPPVLDLTCALLC